MSTIMKDVSHRFFLRPCSKIKKLLKGIYFNAILSFNTSLHRH